MSPVAFPIIAAGEIPFLIGEVHGGIRAVDAWYRKYAPTEMKDVKYCFSFILDPATWHSRSKKIVVPADIKGMKVRPSNATIATWVTQLGGTNVQASASEVRDVLETRRCRGGDVPVGLGAAAGRRQGHQVRHGRGDLDHHVSVGDEPEDLRRHVAGAEEGRSTTTAPPSGPGKFADPWGDFEHAGLAKVKAMPSHEVYSITNDQLERVEEVG